MTNDESLPSLILRAIEYLRASASYFAFKTWSLEPGTSTMHRLQDRHCRALSQEAAYISSTFRSIYESSLFTCASRSIATVLSLPGSSSEVCLFSDQEGPCDFLFTELYDGQLFSHSSRRVSIAKHVRWTVHHSHGTGEIESILLSTWCSTYPNNSHVVLYAKVGRTS
jgi:hypothetical protein